MEIPASSADSPSHDQALRCYQNGLAFLKAGNETAARSAFAESVGLDDSLAPAHYQLGNCLRRVGDTQGAEQALKKAIARDALLTDAYISLFYLYRGAGRRDEARATLMALTEVSPANLAVHYQAAALLQEIGCHAQAVSLYQACLRRDPHNAWAWLRLGQTYQKLGRFGDAERAFWTAIEQDADVNAAYMLLAHTRRFGAADRPLMERFEAALHNPRLGEETVKCLHFGLGKMHDDLGDYDRAFAHFRAANRLHHRHVRFDRRALKNYVETSKSVFTPELFKGCRANEGTATPVPCFIVGMLRSGTTLVERILASHPQVYGLGETESVDALAGQIAAKTGIAYPRCIERLDSEWASNLALQCRNQWPAEARVALRVVDKNPLNFLNLGLIALLFPDAPILHCVRDPLDICLSIYFQHFAHPRNNYAYDLDDIAFFYKQYAELMAHWRKVLPVPLHEICYEDLVGNPEPVIRAAVAATGLDWDPACLESHKHASSISTASLWQARQPIYRDSAGRWRHYAQYLQPLKRALE